MCALTSLVSMFNVPENYADDMRFMNMYVSQIKYISVLQKSPLLQMKLETKPPNSRGCGIIIIQGITVLIWGEKSALLKAGIKTKSKEYLGISLVCK